jgi:hypothetical protein
VLLLARQNEQFGVGGENLSHRIVKLTSGLHALAIVVVVKALVKSRPEPGLWLEEIETPKSASTTC